jgi:SAM-dependent methyltransferase
VSSDPGLAYYEGADLAPVVLDALAAAGRSVDAIDPDDLAQLDEFHALGRASTLALAELAGLEPGEDVLDAGAGIGGPSRVLARHFGARVTALDPTERFCALNRTLTDRTGLGDRISVVAGDARALPFADESFDLVWSQAVWQSVEDKAAAAGDAFRVLRPGGRFALFEVARGPGGELVYPVPWADGPEESFLAGADELRAILVGAGFEAATWNVGADVPPSIQAAAGGEGMAAGLPELSLELVMPDFSARMGGLGRNVAEQRIELVQAVMVRPG